MFDYDDEIARIEFENDELIFRQGYFNPFFIKHKRKEKEYKPFVLTEEEEKLANLFGF